MSTLNGAGPRTGPGSRTNGQARWAPGDEQSIRFERYLVRTKTRQSRNTQNPGLMRTFVRSRHDRRRPTFCAQRLQLTAGYRELIALGIKRQALYPVHFFPQLSARGLLAKDSCHGQPSHDPARRSFTATPSPRQSFTTVSRTTRKLLSRERVSKHFTKSTK